MSWALSTKAARRWYGNSPKSLGLGTGFRHVQPWGRPVELTQQAQPIIIISDTFMPVAFERHHNVGGVLCRLLLRRA